MNVDNLQTEILSAGPVHDVFFPAQEPARGVVLLTHGLNSHRRPFGDLARLLAQNGFEVFLPAFTGHREQGVAEFLGIEGSHWEADARLFHAEVRSRARARGVPLFHVAYSMSALIYMTLAQELRFDRRVFLAPALELHFWYPLIILLARLFPWATFRTQIPLGYYANERGGFRAALALHHFRRRWRHQPDSVPTLILADPKDELVHGPRLRLLAGRSPQWSFEPVSTDGCTLAKRYHHLIIDEASVGKVEWDRMTKLALAFLLAAPSIEGPAGSGSPAAAQTSSL